MYPKLPQKRLIVEPINIETIERQAAACREYNTARSITKKRRLHVRNITDICKLALVTLILTACLATFATAAYAGHRIYQSVDAQIQPIREIAQVQNGELPAEKAVVVRGLFGGLMDIMKVAGADIPSPAEGGSWTNHLRDTAPCKKARTC